MKESVPPQIFALIPAAGKSVRMGRPKLSLPLGNKTIIEHVVTAFRCVSTNVVVMLAPHTSDLAPLIASTGGQPILMPTETPDMRATTEHGLDWLEANCHPDAKDYWFLSPADHPTLDPAVLHYLLSCLKAEPEKSLFLPTYKGKRGHPALVSWKHVNGIRQWDRDKGLNTYFRSCITDTMECEVDNEEIFRDLDTPEDYQRLLKEWKAVSG